MNCWKIKLHFPIVAFDSLFGKIAKMQYYTRPIKISRWNTRTHKKFQARKIDNLKIHCFGGFAFRIPQFPQQLFVICKRTHVLCISVKDIYIINWRFWCNKIKMQTTVFASKLNLSPDEPENAQFPKIHQVEHSVKKLQIEINSR
jgi:hypothetical protein